MTGYDEMDNGGAEGSPTAPADTGTPSSGQHQTIQLDAGSLPGDVKEGDTLTFHVTSPADDSGQVAGYFDAPGGEGSEDSSWENDLRSQLSARNPNREEAQ